MPDRTVTGDGLVNLHVGVELSTSTGRAVLFEYGHLRPIVNDPGDLYSFTSQPPVFDRLPHGPRRRLPRPVALTAT